MADEIKVKPTPIQRNRFDVAMELTELYYRENSVDDIADIQMTFSKFHTMACLLEYTAYSKFAELLPEEIRKVDR